MRKTFFWLLCALVLSIKLKSQPTGYNFGRYITIDASKVIGSSNFTNFPVLINVTSNELRTVANGGFVQDSDGYDIAFFTSCAPGATALNHQIEKYDPITGEYVAWVQIPTLSTLSNTSIGMFYGNSSIISDPSTSTIWDSNYMMVLHLDRNGADATSNGNTSSSGTTSQSLNTKIGNGRSFNGTFGYLQTPISVKNEDNFTLSAWISPDDIDKRIVFWEGHFSQNGWGNDGQDTEQEMHMGLGTCCSELVTEPNDVVDAFLGNQEDESDGEVLNTNSSLTTPNQWHYIVSVFSDVSTAPKLSLYLDGALVGTDVGVADPSTARNNWTTNMRIGRPGANTRYYSGLMDEVRVSNVIRSPELIETEYNNQSDPSTFYTLGTHMTATALCTTLPSEVLHFSAKRNFNTVKIEWKTAKNIKNKTFHLEKSENAVDWYPLSKITHFEDSKDHLFYNTLDNTPYTENTYYRLKQIEEDGTFTYSGVVKVGSKDEIFHIYPNPAKDQFIIKGNVNKEDLHIYNSVNEDVTSNVSIENNESDLVVNLEDLPKGIYLVKSKLYTKKLIKE